jgi:hypothetical protein
MSEVNKPAQTQGARLAATISQAEPARLRNLVLAVLAVVLCFILWALGMLLPSNLTTATVPGSWIKYGVETSQWSFFGEERPRSLYRSVDPLGVLWVRVPISLAHSFNDMHPGVQLIFSPDGSKLFVKRGMTWRGLDYKTIQDRTIWSDCIDVATGQSCGGVRTCCMEERPGDSHTDREGVMRDSKKVEAMARAAGIVD